MATTGQRFKELRNSTGLSQELFGKSIGLTKSAVSAVENDKTFISLEVQRKLLLDFNVDLNYLVGGLGSLYLPAKYEDIKTEIFKEVEKMLKDKGISVD